MKEAKTANALGRPRAFDADLALTSALDVFWRKGYEATSLQDLTEAMGINRPSLYAAFGNKESLFRKAVDRYDAERAPVITAALAEPSARVALERMLMAIADSHTEPHLPPGCLIVQGALGGSSDPISRELTRRRAATEKAIRVRLQKAVKENELPADTNTEDLARYFFSVIAGLAGQARDGASRQELRRVVTLALKAWPAHRG